MSVPGVHAVFSAGLAPTPSAAGAAPTPPSGEHPLDQPLTDALREMSGFSANVGDASHMASPAALFGETLERLRGFLKRADAMSKSGSWTPGHAGSSFAGADLHAGPAQASLEPIWSAEQAQRSTTDNAVGFDEIAQHVLDSMSFALEADLVAKTTSQIGKSTNTLVKGQ
jgi:hypothetical protein